MYNFTKNPWFDFALASKDIAIKYVSRHMTQDVILSFKAELNNLLNNISINHIFYPEFGNKCEVDFEIYNYNITIIIIENYVNKFGLDYLIELYNNKY